MPKMSDQQTKFYFNWKIIALIIGWAGIAVSVGLIVIYGPLTLIYFTLLHNIVFLVTCGMFIFKDESKTVSFCSNTLPFIPFKSKIAF